MISFDRPGFGKTERVMPPSPAGLPSWRLCAKTMGENPYSADFAAKALFGILDRSVGRRVVWSGLLFFVALALLFASVVLVLVFGFVIFVPSSELCVCRVDTTALSRRVWPLLRRTDSARRNCLCARTTEHCNY